jgi:hypothetical protein
MQKKPTAFEAINAGKGRLYPLDREKKLEKYHKLKQYGWFQELGKEQQAEKIPSFDGWLKFDQEVIDDLQRTLDMNKGKPFRYNLDVMEQKRDGKVTQLNIDYWLPTKPAKEASEPEPAPVQNDLPEDDIPF